MNPALIVIVILILSQGSQGKSQGNAFLPPIIGKLSIPPIGKFGIPPIGKFGIPPIGKLGIPPVGPAYFDTFKMELLLDRLHSMTATLEKVNHLNQMRNVPLDKSNSIDRIQESLDAVKGLLYNNKSAKNLDSISNTLSGVKKFGDMEGIMSNMGPILSMLSGQNDK